MIKWIREPVVWLFLIIILWYGGIPAYMLLTDKAEKQAVQLYGQTRDVYVERDSKRIRIPAGCTPSALFKEGEKIRKATYLPPARFMPGIMEVIKDATCEEIRLYQSIFN